jgi:hypothetical protein
MKRSIAATWLVVGGLLTCGALIQGTFIVFGLFDPVAHNGVPWESYPWYMAKLFGIPLLFVATARKAFRAVSGTPRMRSSIE